MSSINTYYSRDWPLKNVKALLVWEGFEEGASATFRLLPLQSSATLPRTAYAGTKGLIDNGQNVWLGGKTDSGIEPGIFRAETRISMPWYAQYHRRQKWPRRGKGDATSSVEPLFPADEGRQFPLHYYFNSFRSFGSMLSSWLLA